MTGLGCRLHNSLTASLLLTQACGSGGTPAGLALGNYLSGFGARYPYSTMMMGDVGISAFSVAGDGGGGFCSLQQGHVSGGFDALIDRHKSLLHLSGRWLSSPGPVPAPHLQAACVRGL